MTRAKNRINLKGLRRACTSRLTRTTKALHFLCTAAQELESIVKGTCQLSRGRHPESTRQLDFRPPKAVRLYTVLPAPAIQSNLRTHNEQNENQSRKSSVNDLRTGTKWLMNQSRTHAHRRENRKITTVILPWVIGFQSAGFRTGSGKHTHVTIMLTNRCAHPAVSYIRSCRARGLEVKIGKLTAIPNPGFSVMFHQAS